MAPTCGREVPDSLLRYLRPRLSDVRGLSRVLIRPWRRRHDRMFGGVLIGDPLFTDKRTGNAIRLGLRALRADGMVARPHLPRLALRTIRVIAFARRVVDEHVSEIALAYFDALSNLCA